MLTQGRFLALLNTEHLTPSTTSPEIIFVICAQLTNYECELHLLKNIECFIEKINELTSSDRRRYSMLGSEDGLTEKILQI